ncbi:MAG: hypothetical protein VKK04_26085 [Synechococcales bacterium]|nr:hypothetical protein [Synechococcales bacterium]
MLGNILGDAIANYSDGVSEILTPEQLRIWQQNMDEYVQNNQSNQQ